MQSFCIYLFATLCIWANAIDVLQENTEVTLKMTKFPKHYYLDINHDISPFFIYITPCGSPIHWQLFEISQDLTPIEENILLSNQSIQLTQVDAFRLIAGEEDFKRMSFFSHKFYKRVIISISASQVPSTARIFFTPSIWSLNDQYPALPHDNRLAISVNDNVTDVSLRVTWKLSSQIKNYANGRYRICTMVSIRDPVYPLCENVDEGIEMIQCVDQNVNSILIDSLKHNRKYFIAVFIRDYIRGTTSFYNTQVVRTPAAIPRAFKRQKKVPPVILRSKLETATFEPKKGATINYRYYIPPGNATQSVMVIIHACNGYVRFNVYRSGKLLKRSDVFIGYRRFIISNVRRGQLKFQLINDDNEAKSVRIWAGTDISSSPYPTLPEDTSVKIVNRSCDRIVMQWLRSYDNGIKYCVYKRKETTNFFEHLVSLVNNLCESYGIASSTLVGCYTQSVRPTAQLIETAVTGLDPFSTYRFDLLATPLNRENAKSLPYRTLWARTSLNCS